jgi:hypothetical protein
MAKRAGGRFKNNCLWGAISFEKAFSTWFRKKAATPNAANITGNRPEKLPPHSQPLPLSRDVPKLVALIFNFCPLVIPSYLNFPRFL